MKALSSEEKAKVIITLFARNSTLKSEGNQSHILDGANVNKEAGRDGIPPFLKKCPFALTPVLCRMFSLAFATGISPKIKKIVQLQLLPKKENCNFLSSR